MPCVNEAPCEFERANLGACLCAQLVFRFVFLLPRQSCWPRSKFSQTAWEMLQRDVSLKGGQLGDWFTSVNLLQSKVAQGWLAWMLECFNSACNTMTSPQFWDKHFVVPLDAFGKFWILTRTGDPAVYYIIWQHVIGLNIARTFAVCRSLLILLLPASQFTVGV